MMDQTTAIEPRLLTSQCSRCSQRYFGFQSLRDCPRCSTMLENISVPFPFVNSMDAIESVLLKPSRGSFLRDYQVGDDLHIGLSNSYGHVISFDKHGLQVDDAGRWSQCLRLLDRSDLERCTEEEWNDRLEEAASLPEWTAQSYNPIDRNCFDFALRFLHRVSIDFPCHDKLTFVRDFVQRPLNRLIKFNRIYRLCLTEGVIRYR